MSRYNQYGNYYDPVGSQANQPTGYTYQGAASGYANPPSSTGHGSTNYQSYGTQQYASNAPPSNSSTTHAAAALSALSGQNYSQPSSTNTTSSSRYDNSNWSNAGANTAGYGANTLAAPNRTQSNNSPLYSSAHSPNTFGRRSVAEQSQSSMNSDGTSQMTYQNAPSSAGVGGGSYQSTHSQPSAQPPRYNSPLHAVQAQQRGQPQQNWQSSTQNQSPQLGNASHSTQHNRQQIASVEPSTTVDPSQVYDNRAELQRKAQIEAERRKKHEAEQAARKAEEERIAEETRKQEAARREEEAARKAEEEAAKKAEAQKRKNEQRQKAREEKKQNKDAATVLQRMSSGNADTYVEPAVNDEEAEMRAMFQKMREFNAKNPAMLAKLWDEERKSHEAVKSTPTPTPAPAAQAPASQQKALNATSPQATAANQIRPFARPAAPAKPPKTASATKQGPTQQATPQPNMAQSPKLPRNQSNTSLWPPHKKGALAEVTAKWLLSIHENEGQTISPKNVLDILDQNPSYVRLCESLEGFGMVFDRSTLARELLKAVPDGLKTQTAPKAATPLSGLNRAAAQGTGASTGSPNVLRGKGKQRREDSMSAPRPTNTVNYEAPISLSEVARELSTSGRRPSHSTNMQNSPPQQQQYSQSPYFAQPPSFTNGSRPASQAGVPEMKPEVKPEKPPRPPADKEEAARKRTFGDLVDLTAEDSDEEQGPPPKRVMGPTAAPSNSFPPQHRDPLAYIAQPTTFKNYMDAPNHEHRTKTTHGPPGFTVPTQWPPGSSNAQPPKQESGVPSPYGQPATNVLPSQLPAPPRPKGPAQEQLQLARMKGKMLVEPIMRDRVARKSRYDSRTIARDVLLATGRHPDMRGLNAHLSVMQKLLGQHGIDAEGGNRFDLKTIRWDAIDPDPPKVEEKEKPLAPKKTSEVDAERKDSEEVAVAQDTAARTASPPALPAKKKRGRPAKLTNPAPPRPATAASRDSQTRTNPPTPSLPSPADMASSCQPLGYSAFQQIDPLTGKKKKGRPFGWKKSVHSREAQGLTPAKAGHSIRPKPAHANASTPAAAEPAEPHYQVYRCEWAGCKSALHNLETLKKHIVKVHGRQEERQFECDWKGCLEGTLDGIEPWLAHVDEAHLTPIAWKLGDGPSAGDPSSFRESPQIPSYLKDSYGRAVTPAIAPRTPAKSATSDTQQQDTLQETSPPPQPSSMEAYGPSNPTETRGPKSATLVLDAELKKLEEQQRIVGPIMGKMGCVLADEGRKRTFLDDEDFEDEVEGSEHEDG
ncbi:uncharacterized protein LTR77_008945 [Saxophila tyrrhenica]|uniref:C2H2-type domain-containing protein n=1 Tax=Saxophila tyrrhenica TaxID=1690608 RepID=A0AAV9NZ35_9PEZI|nr:hypothetical protein LTR77_008945 [Saxophila tyrrhenica]